ncbi:AN1-type zinc finger protein 1-like [Corticium candelabrum]|uniref:AN1-type zinc finger protein 1-like n=1 Tax=Corticium candelabrum TaxID=121492 RepID=UPI002E275240|nr:AN1-type zinc finger protein 1-like [Corticium candelabrum]
MAELDVGTRCSYSSCRQLDFLPFVCPGCQQTFCLEHRACADHLCPAEKRVTVEVSALKDGVDYHPCSLSGCHKSELEIIKCQFCSNTFCLRHRHQEDHDCLALKSCTDDVQQKSLSAIDVLRNAQASVASKGYQQSKQVYRAGQQSRSFSARSSALAQKVALMKLKSRATGDKRVPQEERVFFEVVILLRGEIKTHPTFFSKEWSVGKSVDYCASALSLKNRNNIPSEPRLQLFSRATATALPMSLKLQLCIEKEIITNGESVILAYSSTDKLENIEEFNK